MFKRTTLALAMLISVAWVPFAWQPMNTGFPPGHHGWVSSHTLAIISHATAENGFHGYAVQAQVKRKRGDSYYVYFDRYPVLFSAVMNQILTHGKPTLSEQIMRARYAMNAIFVATLFLSFSLIRALTGDPWRALAATFLVFSGYYWIEYKDMVHFDQPAILGILVLLNAIAHHERTGKKSVLFIGVTLASVLGRGYASLAVLSVWLCVEIYALISAAGGRRIPWLPMLRLSSLWAVLLGVLIMGVNLSYNIANEAEMNDIPFTSTSIVGSAWRRLVGDAKRIEKNEDQLKERLAWGSFSREVARRFVVSLVPHRVAWRINRDTLNMFVWPLVLLLIAPLLYAGFRIEPINVRIWLVMAVSGVLWLFFMRHLTVDHDYTSMYFFGVGLAFWAVVGRALPKKSMPLFALACAGLFVANLWDYYRVPGEYKSAVEVTADFEKIRSVVDSNAVIEVDGGFKNIVAGAPYALGFYMRKQRISIGGSPTHVLSSDGNRKEILLTPSNSRVFLYKFQSN